VLQLTIPCHLYTRDSIDRLYCQLDKLLLLSEGRVMYFGEPYSPLSIPTLLSLVSLPHCQAGRVRYYPVTWPGSDVAIWDHGSLKG